MTRHIHPTARGAAGEELSLDVSVLGDAAAPAMLVLVSGTHGVEGFCGSGCQVGLLHDAQFVAAVRASGVAVKLPGDRVYVTYAQQDADKEDDASAANE